MNVLWYKTDRAVDTNQILHSRAQCLVNSLVPGRYVSNFQSIIFKIIIQNSSVGGRCEIYLK